MSSALGGVVVVGALLRVAAGDGAPVSFLLVTASVLLVFLLGKPDHWEISVAHLRGETSSSAKPTGRDGVYGLLQELINAGYVARRQDRSDAGVLGEINYIVSETPLPDSPYPAAPYPAQPYPANPTLVSIEGKQVLKKPARTEKPSCNSGESVVEFERFWKLYPRKVGKDKAEKAWAKLKVDTALFNRMGTALAAWSKSPDWTKDGGQFIPHAATWLNGKRWEDELPAPGFAAHGSAFNNLPQHTDDMYEESHDGRANF